MCAWAQITREVKRASVPARGASQRRLLLPPSVAVCAQRHRKALYDKWNKHFNVGGCAHAFSKIKGVTVNIKIDEAIRQRLHVLHSIICSVNLPKSEHIDHLRGPCTFWLQKITDRRWQCMLGYSVSAMGASLTLGTSVWEAIQAFDECIHDISNSENSKATAAGAHIFHRGPLQPPCTPTYNIRHVLWGGQLR